MGRSVSVADVLRLREAQEQDAKMAMERLKEERDTPVLSIGLLSFGPGGLRVDWGGEESRPTSSLVPSSGKGWWPW